MRNRRSPIGGTNLPDRFGEAIDRGISRGRQLSGGADNYFPWKLIVIHVLARSEMEGT